MHNGLIKVVTGIRRCGKSFLLNELFRKRLQEMEIKEDNMLFLKMEDWRNRSLRNPDTLLDKIEAFARNNSEKQKKRPLLQIKDSFKKILIVSGHFPPMYDDNGVLTIGLFQFLTTPNIIEQV